MNHGGDEVGPTYLRLPGGEAVGSSAETCKETYGFLPCTTTALGDLFMILVYGYLMYLAAKYSLNGSEMMLETLGTGGVVTGFFLPLLGALPDALLIFASGLSGTTATARDQVSVGMGLLAGSIVMFLTVIWGTCVVVGKCDLQGSCTIDLTDTKGFNLLESGVSTDIWTSYVARIMVISIIPFLVVQLPQAMQSTSERHLAVLIALILSLLMLVSYCLYQIFQPCIQERRLDYVKHKRVLSGFLRHLKKHALGRLCNPDGTPNREVIAKIFKAVDLAGDDSLSKGELKAFVIGMRLEGMNVGEDDIVDKVMKEFDMRRPDHKLELDEFELGITRLLNLVRCDRLEHHADTMKYVDAYDDEAKLEHFLLGEESEEAEEQVENPKKTTIKAIIYLIIGTVIAAVFPDPLVDAVDNFSDATSIPSFYISFVALPLAMNLKEAMSAIRFASKKKRNSASLTFSELYGAVTRKNMLCLSVFLALVYVRGLTWDFSSEVLIIFMVCVVMGALGSFRTIFPLWTASIAFLLYPFSLVLVYILNYLFGWS